MFFLHLAYTVNLMRALFSYLIFIFVLLLTTVVCFTTLEHFKDPSHDAYKQSIITSFSKPGGAQDAFVLALQPPQGSAVALNKTMVKELEEKIVSVVPASEKLEAGNVSTYLFELKRTTFSSSLLTAFVQNKLQYVHDEKALTQLASVSLEDLDFTPAASTDMKPWIPLLLLGLTLGLVFLTMRADGVLSLCPALGIGVVLGVILFVSNGFFFNTIFLPSPLDLHVLFIPHLLTLPLIVLGAMFVMVSTLTWTLKQQVS